MKVCIIICYFDHSFNRFDQILLNCHFEFCTKAQLHDTISPKCCCAANKDEIMKQKPTVCHALTLSLKSIQQRVIIGLFQESSKINDCRN